MLLDNNVCYFWNSEEINGEPLQFYYTLTIERFKIGDETPEYEAEEPVPINTDEIEARIRAEWDAENAKPEPALPTETKEVILPSDGEDSDDVGLVIGMIVGIFFLIFFFSCSIKYYQKRQNAGKTGAPANTNTP